MDTDSENDSANYDFTVIIAAAMRSLTPSEVKKQLARDIKELCDDMTEKLHRQVTWEIHDGADIQECTDIFRITDSAFKRFVVRREFKIQQTFLWKPLHTNLRVVKEVEQAFKSLRMNSACTSGSTLQKFIDEHYCELLEMSKTLTELQRETEQQLNYFFAALKQSYIQKMLTKQTTEVKDHFFMNGTSGSSGDIQAPSTDTRPSVKVELKKTASGLGLPAEIMSMIFSFADLESCVALREVNSEWYSIFQQMDLAFSSKLKQRNPWMQPGDADLQTWRDCVLVFAARLKTWPTTFKLDNIEVPEKEEKRETVVAFRLKHGERLPHNFTGMQPSLSDNCQQACGHLHANSKPVGLRFTYDLWTLQPIEGVQVVRVEGDTTVVKKLGVEITLSTTMMPTEGSNLRVKVLKGSIFVYLDETTALAMPRDKPPFKNGFTFDFMEDDRVSECGNVLIRKSHRRQSDIPEYSFADFETKQMIFYPTPTSQVPTGFYNGLTWWLNQPHSTLVPTFVDQDSPDKIYYNSSKSITGVSPRGFEQTCRSCDSHHFAASHNPGGLDAEIVNFATGSITSIIPPLGWPSDSGSIRVIPGFLNGKFQARIMCDDDIAKTIVPLLPGD